MLRAMHDGASVIVQGRTILSAPATWHRGGRGQSQICDDAYIILSLSWRMRRRRTDATFLCICRADTTISRAATSRSVERNELAEHARSDVVTFLSSQYLL
jgi:hypothetical protein